MSQACKVCTVIGKCSILPCLALEQFNPEDAFVQDCGNVFLKVVVSDVLAYGKTVDLTLILILKCIEKYLLVQDIFSKQKSFNYKLYH